MQPTDLQARKDTVNPRKRGGNMTWALAAHRQVTVACCLGGASTSGSVTRYVITCLNRSSRRHSITTLHLTLELPSNYYITRKVTRSHIHTALLLPATDSCAARCCRPHNNTLCPLTMPHNHTPQCERSMLGGSLLICHGGLRALPTFTRLTTHRSLLCSHCSTEAALEPCTTGSQRTLSCLLGPQHCRVRGDMRQVKEATWDKQQKQQQQHNGQHE